VARVSVSAAVREILTGNIKLTADEVIQKVKAKGVTATADAIRKSVHNQRSTVSKALATKTAPVATPSTAAPKPASLKPIAMKPPAPKSAAPAKVVASEGLPNVAGVLSNVALVNTVVDACGGVKEARQVAEAVRACGGVEPFLQHLDLVAGIRGNDRA
jgi:hypothetical protein